MFLYFTYLRGCVFNLLERKKREKKDGMKSWKKQIASVLIDFLTELMYILRKYSFQ